MVENDGMIKSRAYIPTSLLVQCTYMRRIVIIIFDAFPRRGTLDIRRGNVVKIITVKRSQDQQEAGVSRFPRLQFLFVFVFIFKDIYIY